MPVVDMARMELPRWIGRFLELELDGVNWTKECTNIPESDIHPVLIAKQMLMFALLLQNLPIQETNVLLEPPRVIMKRLADTAIRLMTTNEELLGATESLECIILEAIYQANSGNLRRAWLAFRRAMMVAQMMGIHRPGCPPLQALDPSYKTSPQFMWFRIVYMDRFLSLMLGIPQGTSDNSMASENLLRNDTPSGRLQRMHTVIAGRILERNERNHFPQDFTSTFEIDAAILKAAKSMPDQFWAPPKFIGLDGRSHKAFWETMRLVDQIFHYSLLALLHLPHSCNPAGTGDASKFQYSKVTCGNASREILMRFAVFQSFSRITSFCRPADFFALLASMMLVLAHLDSHRRPPTDNYLAHQRNGDRALMGQVLENMESVAKLNDDVLTDKSASLLRRLLQIEAEAAQGYTFNTEKVDESEVSQGTEDNVLHISIPYLGFLRIARDGISCRELPQAPITDHGNIGSMHTANYNSFTELNIATQSIPPPNQFESSYLPTPSDEMHSQTLAGVPEGLSQTLQPPLFSQFDDTQQQYYPNLAAGVDEWVFQGVDTAFFGSLMRHKGLPPDSEPINGDWTTDWNIQE
jgi:hypothetical protein